MVIGYTYSYSYTSYLLLVSSYYAELLLLTIRHAFPV